MSCEDTVVYTYMKSPHGRVFLARKDAGMTHISFQKGAQPIEPEPSWREDREPLLEAIDQLHAYFYGTQEHFTLPLAPEGTSFQQAVWDALQSIPCGETASYADIARIIGKPKAVRAVGAANGRNPLPIVIPCHRIIGSNGKLTGYAGGLTIKKALLDHEQQFWGTKTTQLPLGV